MKSGENVTSSLEAKFHQSVCTISPEDLVVTDSEEEDMSTREMTAGSSSSNTTTLPSLSNSTNKRKLEEDILQRKERELQLLKLAWMKADLDKKTKSYKMQLVDIQIQREKQFIAWSNAGQDKKKSKRGPPPHPGPSH